MQLVNRISIPHLTPALIFALVYYFQMFWWNADFYVVIVTNNVLDLFLVPSSILENYGIQSEINWVWQFWGSDSPDPMTWCKSFCVIDSFSKYVLSASYVLDTVLGPWDSALNKSITVPALRKFTSSWERERESKYILDNGKYIVKKFGTTRGIGSREEITVLIACLIR